MVAIPKRVPILAPPIVDAVLTSQPSPTPSGQIVVLNPSDNLVISQEGPSYVLQPGATILMRYQQAASRVEWKLIVGGDDSGKISNVRLDEASYTAPQQPGSEVFVSACVIDETGRCNQTTQRVITLKIVTSK